MALLVVSCTAPAPPPAAAIATLPDEEATADRYGARVTAVRVRPKATDQRIGSATEPHFVALARDVPKRGLLFLYLPGTQGQADEARHLTELAAARGFHAIGLRYPNYVAILQLCGTDPDTTCFERARAEAITGADLHDRLSVAPADSIVSRVDSLLTYLAARRRGEGWERFVKDGRTDWSAVVVAGTSQGGGMAAMLARDRVLSRVVMLSSPVESFVNDGVRRAAPWTYQPHATPPDRYFGFAHVDDQFGIDVVREGWAALGVPGTPVLVDGASPPFGGSHQLTTAVSRPPIPPHPMPAAPVTDPSGGLLYLRVWEYLLGSAP